MCWNFFQSAEHLIHTNLIFFARQQVIHCEYPFGWSNVIRYYRPLWPTKREPNENGKYLKFHHLFSSNYYGECLLISVYSTLACLHPCFYTLRYSSGSDIEFSVDSNLAILVILLRLFSLNFSHLIQCG